MRVVFRYNVMGQPNERIALGGENVLAVLNKMTWLDGSYEIKHGETKLGINVNTILTPFGTLKLMTHPLMNGNPVWRNEMYALHPGGITKRVLRDTRSEEYTSELQSLMRISYAVL